MRFGFLFIGWIGLLAAVGAPDVRGQAAGVPIEEDRLSFSDPRVIDALGKLRDSNKLMSVEEVHAALTNPTPAVVKLAGASKQGLSSGQIASLARKGLVRVGWFFSTPRGRWRASAADGYAIAGDGVVATCYHCLEPPSFPGVHEAYLFAADCDFHVYAVRAVLAADQDLDAAVVRIDGGNLTPMALNDQVGPGDVAYLLSDPGETQGFFSTGFVNRFYWKLTGEHDPLTLEGVRSLRINVSTDWSPGSSGAAVLDGCGNVIGHVSMISTLNRSGGPVNEGGPTTGPTGARGSYQSGATYVVLHEAVPARGVRLLVEGMDGVRSDSGATTRPASGAAKR